jgi:hypothetical protein
MTPHHAAEPDPYGSLSTQVQIVLTIYVSLAVHPAKDPVHQRQL